MPEFPASTSRHVLEPDCDRCPALVDCRTEIAWGNGSLDADVVVVGEAPAAGVEPSPGNDADADPDPWRGGNHTGMAYTSRHSGRRVRAFCADLGFDPRAECYFTNAVKCYPGDSDGSNREPTDEERANCRRHLETELRRVDPRVVLATGKHATLAVLGDDAPDGFLDAVLDLHEAPDLGVAVLPLLHPSYQEVWLARLGYEYEEYVAAARDAVERAALDAA